MKIRRGAWLAVLALLVSTLATTSAFADTITLQSAPNRNAYGGGAFVATTSAGSLPLANSTFDTFCIEYNEHFSFGTTYNYTISDGAINGGAGGGNPDKISLGTAYLYSQYLDDPNHASWTGDQQQALQEAIWYLEEEGQPCSAACLKVLTDAGTALGKTTAELMADANGAYGVVALNLTNLDKSPAQDQLGRVPEAEATLLLSMGLVGLAWFARRKNLLPSGVRPLNV